jgi:hypothetical protein
MMNLKDLKSGDMFGCYPHGFWETNICKAEHCKTFHWGLFVSSVDDDKGNLSDWVTSETISTGTDISRLAGRKVRVYRVKSLPTVDPINLVLIHSEYGDLPYNMDLNFRTAIWYFFGHYLHMALPVIKPKKFNCITWVDLVMGILGYQIVPTNQYVTEAALEQSPMVDYLGDVNG